MNAIINRYESVIHCFVPVLDFPAVVIAYSLLDLFSFFLFLVRDACHSTLGIVVFCEVRNAFNPLR